MRLIITSDWELTTDRLPVAEVILKELCSHIRPDDHLVFCGDMFREFNAATVTFAKKILGVHTFDEGSLFLVGNHDREIGADRLSALLLTAITVPTVIGPYAFLPAPDRAAFGASRQAEGRRARDAALSEALEAALISLETQIGPENLGCSILFFHGAVSGDEVAPGQTAAGLTWTIPGARLARWGLAIGGHLHLPSQHGNVYSVGGIANWTFSDRAEQFRALVVDTDTLAVESIPLLRALVPIELTIESPTTTTVIANRLMTDCAVKPGDTLNLKLHFKLPPEQLALLPANEAIEAGIADAAPVNIQRLIVSREPVGLSKVRLETADARSLSLKELFGEYMRVNGKVPTPEVQAEVDKGLDWLEESYKPGEGNLGFKPLRLRVDNFRQWEHAELNFEELIGSVAITGDNATGKSNLLEAMLFALYKHSPSSAESIDKDLKLGATSGSVELIFEAGGREYTVRRALELGKGGVTCKSELLTPAEYENGMDADGVRRIAGLEPVCETAAEIDREIARIVCSYELATATIWHMQRTLDRFVDSTPAEHAKLFLEELSLDRFEPLRLASTNKAEMYLDNNKVLEAKVEELEAQISADDEALEAMPTPQALANRIEASNKLLTIEAEKLLAIRADREQWVTKRAALQKMMLEKADLERRLKAIQDALARPIEDSGARPTVPALDVETLDRRAGDLKARREELLEADAAKRKEIAKAEGEVAAHEAAVERIGKEIELLEAQIKGYEASQGKLQIPPCRIPFHVVGTPIEENCPAWLYYSKADQGKELQEKLGSARGREVNEIQAAGTAQAHLTEAKVSLDPITAELSAIAPKIRELEQQIGDYRNALHAAQIWEERAKVQIAHIQRRADQEAEKSRYEAELKAIETELKTLEEVKKRVYQADAEITNLEAEMTRLRGIIAEAEGAAQRRADLITALEKKRTRQGEHRNTIGENNVKREAWETLAAALSKSGIPYLLMERMIGSFEREANEILTPAGLSLQLQTVSSTKKGEARDKITILFTDERGQHPLAQASGAQRTYIGLAGTAALSHVSALFWGAKPEIYIQDEGWDRIHISRHDIARELIAKIAEKFTRFIYITHVEALADSADVRLRVVSVNGRSELQG